MSIREVKLEMLVLNGRSRLGANQKNDIEDINIRMSANMVLPLYEGIISGGFRSYRGAEIFAILRSVVATIIKKGGNPS